MRTGAAVIVGLVLALACVFGVETIIHILLPLPPGIDPTSEADQARLMAAMPFAAKAMVVLGWFAASLLGGWVANLIARRALAGWVLALLVVAGGVTTMVLIPHPLWMWAGGILLPLVGAWLAQQFARMPL